MFTNNELSTYFVQLRIRVKDIDKVEKFIFDFTESLGQRYLLQSDYYHCPQGIIKIQKYMNDVSHTKILFYNRIGNENDDDKFFCLKMSTEDNSEETSVILSLALNKMASINIIRRQFCKDNFIINLDLVENMGYFMNIKHIVEDDKICREKVWLNLKKTLLTKFDINESEILPTVSYAELLINNILTTC